jgi:hypothetical protein
MTENRLKNTLPLISPWQGSRLGRPSRPRPGLVARGEVEPDLVELAILSHTRTAQARPDGLPPVRTAFEELRAPEREVDTEQSVVKVEDSARTKRRAASSRLGPWIPGLLHFMAYSVSFVMYCVSAFVIGEISLLKFNATRGNYSDPITLCSDFRGSIPAQHSDILGISNNRVHCPRGIGEIQVLSMFKYSIISLHMIHIPCLSDVS